MENKINVKEVIEETIIETLNAAAIYEEEYITIMKFIGFLNKLNLNTISKKESMLLISTELTSTSEVQDTLIDFLQSLAIRLRIKDIDLSILKNMILPSLEIVSNSKLLTSDLRDIIGITDNMDDLIILCIIIKIYGVTIYNELNK